jgi:hypothetical protein
LIRKSSGRLRNGTKIVTFSFQAEIVQKVPKGADHQVCVLGNDTAVLVRSSDRRIADGLKKKPSD